MILEIDDVDSAVTGSYSGNDLLDASSRCNQIEGRLLDFKDTRGRLLSLPDVVEFVKDLDLKTAFDAANTLGYHMRQTDVSGAGYPDFSGNIRTLLGIVEKLEFELTAEAIRRYLEQETRLLAINASIVSGIPTSETLPDPATMNRLLCDIVHRFSDEAKRPRFYYLDVGGVKHWSDPLIGWEAVIAAIPATAYEVGQASKCFAAEIYTGCAMHLCRAVELGLPYTIWA